MRMVWANGPTGQVIRSFREMYGNASKPMILHGLRRDKVAYERPFTVTRNVARQSGEGKRQETFLLFLLLLLRNRSQPFPALTATQQ